MLQDKMNKLFAAGFTITTDGEKTTFTKTVEGDLEDAIDSLLVAHGFGVGVPGEETKPIKKEITGYYSILVNTIRHLFDSITADGKFGFSCRFGDYEIVQDHGRVYLRNRRPTTYANEVEFVLELQGELPLEYQASIFNNTICIEKAA